MTPIKYKIFDKTVWIAGILEKYDLYPLILPHFRHLSLWKIHKESI